MFPVTDFDFVVCGIATFAATVGYACTRKLSTTFPAPPNSGLLGISDTQVTILSKPEPTDDTFECSDAEKTTSVTRQSSLKRKREDDHYSEDAGYPHNLSQIYPNKRCRTPSSDIEEGDKPSPEASASGLTSKELVAKDNEPVATTTIAAPQQAAHKASNAQDQSSNEQAELSSEERSPISAHTAKVAPVPRPTTPLARRATPFAGGFAAFAAAGTSFSPAGSGRSSPASPEKPVWCDSKSPSKIDVFGAPVSPNDTEGAGVVFSSTEEHTGTPAPLAPATPAKTTYTHVTGEEDEDVTMELKGVKLFVKRGARAFSDGMPGHLKLLANRTTNGSRLLFRREPLWQVSMNVRLQPTVRAAFDADEQVLRLILQEAVGVGAREVVVYAIRPGRVASKKDFRDFAEALVANAGFKP